MDIENAKKCIDSQLIKAIYSDYPIDNFHPIRVIQALKSLIGINIEEPSRKLIKWGDSYLDNINLLPDDYYKNPINKSKETIVLSDIAAPSPVPTHNLLLMTSASYTTSDNIC